MSSSRMYCGVYFLVDTLSLSDGLCDDFFVGFRTSCREDLGEGENGVVYRQKSKQNWGRKCCRQYR